MTLTCMVPNTLGYYSMCDGRTEWKPNNNAPLIFYCRGGGGQKMNNK